MINNKLYKPSPISTQKPTKVALAKRPQPITYYPLESKIWNIQDCSLTPQTNIIYDFNLTQQALIKTHENNFTSQHYKYKRQLRTFIFAKNHKPNTNYYKNRNTPQKEPISPTTSPQPIHNSIRTRHIVNYYTIHKP